MVDRLSKKQWKILLYIVHIPNMIGIKQCKNRKIIENTNCY